MNKGELHEKSLSNQATELASKTLFVFLLAGKGFFHTVSRTFRFFYACFPFVDSAAIRMFLAAFSSWSQTVPHPSQVQTRSSGRPEFM